jgi:hypothetical protein
MAVVVTAQSLCVIPSVRTDIKVVIAPANELTVCH